MKKFLLAFILAALAASQAVAQHVEIGGFGNLMTRTDPKTRREIPLNADEVRNIVSARFDELFKEGNSPRTVDRNNIIVTPRDVLVPVIGLDGSPFYTVSINRQNGMSNDVDAINAAVGNPRDAEMLNLLDKMEARSDAVGKKAKKYLEANPQKPKDTFQPTLKDNTGSATRQGQGQTQPKRQLRPAGTN